MLLFLVAVMLAPLVMVVTVAALLVLPGVSKELLLLLFPKAPSEDPGVPLGDPCVPLAVITVSLGMSSYLAAMGVSLAVLWLLVSLGAAPGVSLAAVGVRAWGGVPASLSWRIVRLDCAAGSEPPL